MKMMEIVIQNILLFYFVITYLGIMLGLLVIENLLLVKKTRQTIATFFIILTVLTAVAYISAASEVFSRGRFFVEFKRV